MSHPTLITVTSTQIYNELMKNISVDSISTISWRKKDKEEFAEYNNNPYCVTPYKINTIINVLNYNDNILNHQFKNLNQDITQYAYNIIKQKTIPYLSATAIVSCYNIKNKDTGTTIITTLPSTIQKTLENHHQRLYMIDQNYETVPSAFYFYIIDSSETKSKDNQFTSITDCLTYINKCNLPQNTSIIINFQTNYTETLTSGIAQNYNCFTISHKNCLKASNTKIIFQSDPQKNQIYTINITYNGTESKLITVFNILCYCEFKNLNLNIMSDKLNATGFFITNSNTCNFSNISITNCKINSIDIQSYSISNISNSITISSTTAQNCINIENFSTLIFTYPFQCILSNSNIGITVSTHSLCLIDFDSVFQNNENNNNYTRLSSNYISGNNIFKYFLNIINFSQSVNILPEYSNLSTWCYDSNITPQYEQLPYILDSTITSNHSGQIYSTLINARSNTSGIILSLKDNDKTSIINALNINETTYDTLINNIIPERLSALIKNEELTKYSLYYISLSQITNSEFKFCNINNIDINIMYSMLT